MFEQERWSYLLPSVELEVCDKHLKQFFSTMLDRQRIWYRRFGLHEPRERWTNDPILRDNKFTNVYRELDRNSQWLIKNVLLNQDNNPAELIWKIMLFRYFNEPALFEHASGVRQGTEIRGWKNGIPSYYEYDEDEFADHILQVRATGQRPYTKAYYINTKRPGYYGKGADYIFGHVVIPTLHKSVQTILNAMADASSPEVFIEYLKTLPQVSDFTAHEFYQDFTYISIYTDYTFFRWTQDDFTNVGPGAALGLRLIFPNLRTYLERIEGITRLRDMSSEELVKIGTFPYIEWDKEDDCYNYPMEPKLSLHQIEMWLCEYGKYWKMQVGEGKQRSKFQPNNNSLKYQQTPIRSRNGKH